ncbi:hypothetical protein F5144DRAFT_277246 [Chaetomium tenue]|uniref:Uncharacterized protein n=1 Tax=Chaetomium tenue TaxID=1854479 RepID=A0ACB7P324_9PEZI|nr:hypothetical protein F5144DRAFT_277246 [Chaetomium globosum]
MIAVLKAVLDSTDLKRVHELRDMAIPEPWREAWIFLDHTPCKNCWEFLQKLKQVTGINIYVETRPFLTKKNRQDDIGCRNCACARCKRRFGAEQARDTQPDPGRCDDGGELEPSNSGENAAVPSHNPNPEDAGPAPQMREDRVNQRFVGGMARPEALPAASRAPRTWRHFVDEETGLTYAKPVVRRPLGRRSISSPKPASTPELREPISTIAGRSGFFATPDPGRSVEIQIPKMSPRARAEYVRIPNVSDTLNLGRFAYKPPIAPTQAPKEAGRQRKPQRPYSGGKNAKVAATRGRSRTRVCKLERTRARSSFARAVEHHQRRRAGKA